MIMKYTLKYSTLLANDHIILLFCFLHPISLLFIHFFIYVVQKPNFKNCQLNCDCTLHKINKVPTLVPQLISSVEVWIIKFHVPHYHILRKNIKQN